MFPIYYLYHGTNFRKPEVHCLTVCKQKLNIPSPHFKRVNIFSPQSSFISIACIRNQKPLVNIFCHTACSEIKSQWKSWEKHDLYSRTWTILIINVSNKDSHSKSMAFPFPEIKSIRNTKFYLKIPKDLKSEKIYLLSQIQVFQLHLQRDFSSL